MKTDSRTYSRALARNDFATCRAIDAELDRIWQKDHPLTALDETAWENQQRELARAMGDWSVDECRHDPRGED